MEYADFQSEALKGSHGSPQQPAKFQTEAVSDRGFIWSHSEDNVESSMGI